MVRVGSVGALPSSGAFPWAAHLEVTNVQRTVGEVFAIPTLQGVRVWVATGTSGG